MWLFDAWRISTHLGDFGVGISTIIFFIVFSLVEGIFVKKEEDE